MIRLIFASVMVLHGALHLIGFAKEWRHDSGDKVRQTSMDTASTIISRSTGLLWLFTCLAFAASAVLYLANWESYWLLAIAALLTSQTLIFIDWQNAKYGTIVNIVILVPVIFSAAGMRS